MKARLQKVLIGKWTQKISACKTLPSKGDNKFVNILLVSHA
jgi:hypothetical protein